ncbi:MAG: orotidine-5'-phosphate decarboxylase [Actinomycetota bacterium]|nr:orotidine-5'-phosphate decarboxylase [Actinomycetota bacterium]
MPDLSSVMADPEERLCIALDSPDPKTCLELARAVAPSAGVLKVGLAAFTAGGPDLARRVAQLRPVFLDLKLHDIPAQVAGAVTAAGNLGVGYASVHAAGGRAMLEAAVEAAPEDLTLLAITVLTSLDTADLADVGVGGPLQAQVLRLTKMALDAGAGGVVCSPHDVQAVRARFGPRSEAGPLLVVPGIRPAGEPARDQKRSLSPRQALELGADVLVVGRPITLADDPAASARRVVQEMAA